jgi:hypothetical protein
MRISTDVKAFQKLLREYSGPGFSAASGRLFFYPIHLKESKIMVGPARSMSLLAQVGCGK